METTTRVSSYRFVIGGLVLWGHLATGASLPIVSPILPIISADYGINHASASLLVSAWTISFAVFCLPASILVGRIGVWRTYTISWILTGLPTLAVLSPSFEGLLVLRVASGMGAAMMVPATGPLLMQWFRPREIPIMASLNMATASLGLVVSTSVAAPLANVMDWKLVVGLFGASGLAAAFAWMFWGKTREDVGGRTGAPVEWGQVWAVLRNRTILLLGFADSVCFAQYFALSAWLPTFYNETRGMSLSEGGFITSQFHFMGIFGVLVGGVLALKVRPRRKVLILAGAIVGVFGLGTFLVENTPVNYGAVMVVGFAAWLYTPIIFTLPMELPGMTPNKVAIAWASVITAEMIGVSIAPPVVGAMADSLGTFIPGFVVFNAVAWLLFISAFFLPEPSPETDVSPGPTASATPV